MSIYEQTKRINDIIDFVDSHLPEVSETDALDIVFILTGRLNTFVLDCLFGQDQKAYDTYLSKLGLTRVLNQKRSKRTNLH